MGLNFNYRIYLKREKLKDTFKYVLDKSRKENSPIEFKNDNFYKIEYPHLPLNQQKKIIIEDLFEKRFLGGFSLFFERDNKILEYKLRQVCNGYDSEYDNNFQVSLKDKIFSIGNIDISIEDYSSKISGFVEIQFTAVTSSMSILFEESKSIESFFKSLCKEMEAEYGCLDKEHNGYRLIWFEGEEYNLNLPHSESNSVNEPFRKYGFIPLLKKVTNEK